MVVDPSDVLDSLKIQHALRAWNLISRGLKLPRPPKLQGCNAGSSSAQFHFTVSTRISTGIHTPEVPYCLQYLHTGAWGQSICKGELQSSYCHNAWFRFLKPQPQCCFTRKRSSTAKSYQYGNNDRWVYI